MFSLFEIILLIFVGFLSVYGIIDRICRCVEHNITSKHIHEFIKSGAKKIDATELFKINKEN